MRTHHRYISSAILALAFFVLALGNVFGQDPDTISIETNLVNVGVTVTDRNGNYVTGLEKEHFEVLDNGSPQDVVLFSEISAPVSYGFVYDLHPTTSESTKRILDSIREFTTGLRPADDFFTIVFNERGSLVLDFVPSVDQVSRHLSLGERGEPRSLYDAIVLAAEKANERSNSKRTLIVISDGRDEDSHHSYSSLSRRLRELNVQIYAVFVGEGREYRYSDISRERQPRALDSDLTLDRAALEELARRSGGSAQQPFSEDQINLMAVYERISTEMKKQYSLGFYPSKPDGKWHKLKVRIDHPIKNRNLRLVYRKGYQSPRPQ